MGVIEGHSLLFIAWLANPGYFGTMIISPSWRRVRYFLAFLAFILSLTVFFVDSVPTDLAGNTEKVIPGIGAYLWISAMLLNVIYHRDRYLSKHSG
jgi:hypothetical protein